VQPDEVVISRLLHRHRRTVVHATPRGDRFGGGRQDMHIFVLPELILQCGDVPLVPYGSPGRGSWVTGSSRTWPA